MSLERNRKPIEIHSTALRRRDSRSFSDDRKQTETYQLRRILMGLNGFVTVLMRFRRVYRPEQ